MSGLHEHSRRRPRRRAGSVAALCLALAALGAAPGTAWAARISDLTTHDGDAPRRLVGYGLVVGLDGTGDRSFGTLGGGAMTVRSVVNLLRRFQIEVPPEHLRLRNVAAVLVTAEVSPYLRAGGRFEVQVSALGDATSLRGGVLWMTPLVTDPNRPPVATAQGPLYVGPDAAAQSAAWRHGNSARMARGGVLETDLEPAAGQPSRLLLRDPDLGTAARIAAAVDAAFGAGSARVGDPGVVALALRPVGADSARADSTGAAWAEFLAAVDTLSVTPHDAARVVIDARAGTVVAGGDARVGPAVVSQSGITLEVGSAERVAGPAGDARVRLGAAASVEDVAAGLHAAGVRPEEIVAILEALRAAGALRAEVVVR